MDVVEVAKSAKNASVALAAVKDDVKNGALAEIAKVLRARSQQPLRIIILPLLC